MKRPSAAAPSSSDKAEPQGSRSSAEQPTTSLRNYFRAAPPSISSSAAQPATVPRSSVESTPPSASSNVEHRMQISSILDVRRWLAKEPIASCNNEGVRRIREVAALTKRDDIKPHLKKWQVAQQRGERFLSVEELLHEFHNKIITAAQKLQLCRSAAQPALISAGAQQPASSTAQQSAQHKKRRVETNLTDGAEQPAPGRSTITFAQHADENRFYSESPTPSGIDPSSVEDRSAARPAAHLDDHAEPRSLQECSDWLQAIPPQEIAQSKPLQRLQSTTELLQRPSSRQQRQEVQTLLDSWGVPQKAQGRKRKYEEVKEQLITKVLEEMVRLRRLEATSEAPSPNTSATTPGGHFSAIQAALQHGSIKSCA